MKIKKDKIIAVRITDKLYKELKKLEINVSLECRQFLMKLIERIKK